MDGSIRLGPGVAWRLVDGAVVAWVAETGATHALDPALSVLLCRIAESDGRSAAALAATIDVADECQAAFPAWFEQALARLAALNLIVAP